MELAIRNANVKEVTVLLNSGIDVNALYDQGQTALMLACRGRCLELVQLLLNRGANVNATDEWNHTALHEAVMSDFQITRLLLKHGANINSLTFENYSPLHLVAREGNIGMSMFLIQNGANVNSQAMIYTKEGLHHMGPTILFDAVKEGKTKMVELLLKHGADPSIPDFYGQTALDVAPNDTIKTLLKNYQEPIIKEPSSD
jgi:ankyrin repeat protein